jgi:hypothetical protein
LAGQFKLREAVFKRLRSQPGEKLKARELAEWIIATFPEAAAEKLKKSSFIESEVQLRNQLVAEIGANRPLWEEKFPSLRSTAEKPRRFYWSNETDEQVVEAVEAEGEKVEAATFSLPPESALYDKVREYVSAEYGVLAMRIDEKTSSNKKGFNANRWLFPDLCGLQNLVSGYQDEILALLKLAGGRKGLLWSFEVKVLLNTSNVRESYFQAVSNSSWANFGYLVAAQIDEKVMPELRVLHNLHGIGVIQLDADDPVESQTLIPASPREMVDWGAMNRLAEENADFRKFSKQVKNFYLTDESPSSAWR